MLTLGKKFDPIYEKKPSGYIIIDGNEVARTLQCCHGGEHFISVRGSGIRRGWCLKCQKPTCGKAKCDPCIPFQEKLDLYEGKAPSKSKWWKELLKIKKIEL